MSSVTGDRHHYIRNGDGTEELFDFRADPDEQSDLAASPESADLLEQFRRSLPVQRSK
jgi:hypothetical protein